ncbi:DNA-3-methyladenine glycosylase [Mammaliicoccus sp. M-M45]|uniref:DNA-3-methyladenine glycosylase family protein n=1 Tax=Mammaliicoccus sp. M-M45 TaxID=2898704 RepID=UPI001EFB4A93|nr:DNA-3-methyladenine glycosylase [Mammaliicoccus sp. M-M45]
MEEIRIECPDIFDYEQCLAYLKRDENEMLFDIVDDKIYRAIKIDDIKLLLSISYERHYLIVEILNDISISPENTERLVNFIEEWFDFSADLSLFYQYGRKNEILEPLINELYGLRLIRIPDFFEAISWGIIGQQINLTFAYQLKKRLVESYGEKMTFENKSYYIHPTVDVISKITVKELMDLKFSRRKAEYLIDVAKIIHSQMLTKDMLLNMEDKVEIEKTLVNIRGIGPWAAHYVMMRSIGVKNAFPIGDVGLQNALKAILNLEQKPSKEQMIALNKGWEMWSSYATFYIWRAPYIKK